MSSKTLWKIGKVLEGLGMVIVLAGVMVSINLGMSDQTLNSMRAELQGLGIGMGLFLSGYLLERWAGKS